MTSFYSKSKRARAGWGRAAAVKKTLPIAVVASRASLVSVVGGSIPDEGVFFCFLSKNALSGKNAYTGVYCITGVILYNKAYLAFRRGPGASGLPAFFFGAVLSVAELNPTPQKIDVKKRAFFRQTHFCAGLAITHKQGRAVLGCCGSKDGGTCAEARCAVRSGVWCL